MYKVKIFNNIAASGLEKLDSNRYQIIDDLSKSTSIVLRSHKLTEDNIPLSIDAIGRAGAGVNNIPVDAMSCLLYTSPSPRDRQKSRMPSSA